MQCFIFEIFTFSFSNFPTHFFIISFQLLKTNFVIFKKIAQITVSVFLKFCRCARKLQAFAFACCLLTSACLEVGSKPRSIKLLVFSSSGHKEGSLGNRHVPRVLSTEDKEPKLLVSPSLSDRLNLLFAFHQVVLSCKIPQLFSP